MNRPVKHIAVTGAGLSGVICARALANVIPSDTKLSLIHVPGADKTDVFYGSTTAPSAYDFLLSLGLSEPDLLPNTNSVFSLGTRYANWGLNNHSWLHTFYKPLPVFNGVEFHHYLTRLHEISPQDAYLAYYIMSSHAADKGVFAHPPEDKKTPLSSVAYGYHFLPKTWRELIFSKLDKSRIQIVEGQISSVQRDGQNIKSISLSNGDIIEADLFIDCTGPNSNINDAPFSSDRHLKAAASFLSEGQLKQNVRNLIGMDYGWYSETEFQDGAHRLTIYSPESEETALRHHGHLKTSAIKAPIGHSDQPWSGNYLAFGHTAAILEPLTPAPFMLLQRDIERLIELIPLALDMEVEAREYNRRFNADYCHASIFHRGFFTGIEAEVSPYWESALKDKIDQKLSHKLTQFQSRGIVVQYDLEPFVKEDWIQQHMGLARLPMRYDPIADKIDQHQLIENLRRMRRANELMASKLPPHNLYMKKLLEYFRKKNV